MNVCYLVTKQLYYVTILLISYLAMPGTTAAQTTTGTPGLIAPPRIPPPGERFLIDAGRLFVPAGYADAPYDGHHLILYFHGQSWCAEQQFHASGVRDALFLSRTLPMAQYRTAVGRQGYLAEAEAEVTALLARRYHTPPAPVTTLTLVSFSGGWSAVRALLEADGGPDPRITAVLLADSLYPRDANSPVGESRIDPAAIAPFVAFARSAQQPGSPRRFLYSYLYPRNPALRGNTTARAAEYLTSELGLTTRPVAFATEQGWIDHTATRGGVMILAIQGHTTQDHFNHLYGLSSLLRQLNHPPPHR